MSIIGSTPVQQTAASKANAASAPAQTAPNVSQTAQAPPSTAAALTTITEAPSSPSSSVAVTNAQGNAARSALGPTALSLEQPKEAEAAVAANEARKTNIDFNSLQSMEARKNFVQNITQLDGHEGGHDGANCGPTALVSSLTMADPKATQKLAKGVLDLSSSDRKKMFGDRTLGKSEAEALRRLANGNASPEDVRVLGNVMSETKGVNASDGSTPEEMAKMLSSCSKILGDDMPNFNLHMYASADKVGPSHWQGYANGVEIDPWPNSKGQATLTEGPAGLAQGASRFENGTVHTKMIVEDHGKRIVMPRYLSHTGGDGNLENATRVHNPNPNDPLTTYVYTQDFFGYGYTRKEGQVPDNVDPTSEPGNSIGSSL
jgi:hypothetical protein